MHHVSQCHWTENPAHYERNKAKYAENKATIFQVRRPRCRSLSCSVVVSYFQNNQTTTI